jgi:hypothetical protein
MPQNNKNVVTEILLFDFELFIGALSPSASLGTEELDK